MQILVLIGLVVTELYCHKINLNTTGKKYIFGSILKDALNTEAWWCKFGGHFGHHFGHHFGDHRRSDRWSDRRSATSDIISEITSVMISEVISEVMSLVISEFAPPSFRIFRICISSNFFLILNFMDIMVFDMSLIVDKNDILYVKLLDETWFLFDALWFCSFP